MEPLTILRADPLDLLFENRNKDYGAYTLRKYYTRRLMISLALVILAVVMRHNKLNKGYLKNAGMDTRQAA